MNEKLCSCGATIDANQVRCSACVLEDMKIFFASKRHCLAYCRCKSCSSWADNILGLLPEGAKNFKICSFCTVPCNSDHCPTKED